MHAAQAKLSAAAKLTELERRLIDDAPAVADARERLVAAEQHVRDLDLAFANVVDTDPAVLEAQRRLDAARMAAALGPAAPAAPAVPQ